MAQFSTITDLIDSIEEGMGSEGSRAVAAEMAELYQLDDYVELGWNGYSTTAKYDLEMNDQRFFDLWNIAETNIN